MIEEELKLDENERIQVVSILTPNFLHYPMAKKLLENNFNVICEKPMTTTYEEARDLENIYKSLQKRDESDTNRTISPLRVPDNAEIIDTSDLKPDAIVDKILNLYTITKN